MNRFTYIFVLLAAVMLLQGCDMVRGGLGMPTSDDIEQMKQELQEKEQQELQKLQELERAALAEDSIRKAREEQLSVAQIKGYHVIIGSFRVTGMLRNWLTVLQKKDTRPCRYP